MGSSLAGGDVGIKAREFLKNSVKATTDNKFTNEDAFNFHRICTPEISLNCVRSTLPPPLSDSLSIAVFYEVHMDNVNL